MCVAWGWEVVEEGIQEAGGLLCHLAALLWGSKGHAQSIPGGLLPGLQSGFTLGRDMRVSKNIGRSVPFSGVTVPLPCSAKCPVPWSLQASQEGAEPSLRLKADRQDRLV